MKKPASSIIVIFGMLILNGLAVAQNSDSPYLKRISALSWMPDGKAILLNIVKIDPSRKRPPQPAKYRLDLRTNKMELLPIEGGGLSAAPDGKSVAYIKRVNNRDQIYAYWFASGKDQLLVGDTLRKFALGWSNDGQKLIYNTQTGTGTRSEVQICIYALKDQTSTRITNSAGYRSYAPAWNPKSNEILYFLEKGDQHDQIYVTDERGSFHTNLTNDTTTNNHSPSWMDANTILYAQAPDHIMTMNKDGSQKQRLAGIRATQFAWHSGLRKMAYLDEEGRLILYDWDTKKTTVLIDSVWLNGLK